MKDLFIPADSFGKTPLFDFKQSGELLIEGRSITDNVIEHYQPAIDWISNLNSPMPREIKMTVKLEYFNTRSSKMLLNVFKALETIHLSAKSNVEVIWLYGEDDRDMLEAGQDYRSVVKIPFNLLTLVES
jgi:Domain of unknown function (DUF1987).